MVDAKMCNPQSKLCAYSECEECVYTSPTLLRPPANTEIALNQWSLEYNTKVISGEGTGKRSWITVKKKKKTADN